MRAQVLTSRYGLIGPLLIAVSVCAGACAGSKDRGYRALSSKGRTEADVVHDAGPPALTGNLKTEKRAYVKESCTDPDGRMADRFLEYHIPSEGVERRVRDLLRLGPGLVILVCVDASNTVTSASHIVLN